MSKAFTLTAKELNEFTNSEKKLYADGPTQDGGRKKLYVTLNGNYEVFIDEEKIFEGNQPRPAVEAFNEEQG